MARQTVEQDSVATSLAPVTAGREQVQLRNASKRVYLVQWLINRVAITERLDEDGEFGPKTEQAVEDVQRRFGLPASGVVERETASLLLRLAGKASHHDEHSTPNRPLARARDVMHAAGVVAGRRAVLAFMEMTEWLHAAARDGVRYEECADLIDSAFTWAGRLGHPKCLGRECVPRYCTFKVDRPLTAAEKQALYRQRVSEFTASGGRFDRLQTSRLDSRALRALVAGYRYDYVMTVQRKLYAAVQALPGEVTPAPGHILLGERGPVFTDAPVTCAGEIVIHRDRQGHLCRLLFSNNSGNYRPSSEALGPVREELLRLGAVQAALVPFCGKSNLPGMLAETIRACASGDGTTGGLGDGDEHGALGGEWSGLSVSS